MKSKKNEDFCKVMGIGNTDYDININLTQEEASSMDIDLNRLNTINDWKIIMKNNEIKEKIKINFKNNIINLLLFLNKTSKNKIFVELLSLNSFVLNEDLKFFNEKIKNEFDNNFLFLIEQNILPPYPTKFSINIEGKVKEIELNEKPQKKQEFNKTENEEEDDNDEGNLKKSENVRSIQDLDENNITENRKNDDEEIIEVGKSDESFNVAKREANSPTKSLKLTSNEELQDVKNNQNEDENIENKIIEKNLNDNEQLVSNEKPEEQQQDQKQNDEEILEDNVEVNRERIINDEKENFQEKIEVINENIQERVLPGVEKDENQEEDVEKQPEGKDNYLNENKSTSGNVGKKVLSNENLLSNLRYDYETIDYIFLDLNKFVNSKITLTDLYNYLTVKLSLFKNTSIVVIYPNLSKLEIDIKNDTIDILIDIISISDIIIYEKKDAMILCSLLEYKVEEKNFEVRFMFLKEFKKSKKQTKTCIFLEDFNKLSVIVQSTDTSLITYHNQFNFDVGFKMDYFETIHNHFDYLKFVFLGGFFSGVVQNQNYDLSFKTGAETFRKVLDLIHNNLPEPSDSEYFIVDLNNKGVSKKNSKSTKILDKKAQTSNNFNKKHVQNEIKERESNFVLDAVRIANKKGIIVPEILEKKQYKLPYNSTQTSNFFNKTSKNFMDKSNSNKAIDVEQKKLLSILKANEKIQEKLNKLLSSSPDSRKYFEKELKYAKSKKLPSLMKPQEKENRQNILFNNRNEEEIEKKKVIKPISKETYDRLTGNSRRFNYLNEANNTNNQQKLNSSPPKELQEEINNYHFSPIKEKDLNNSNDKGGSPVKENPDNLKNSSIVNFAEKSEIKIKIITKPKFRLVKNLIPVCNLGNLEDDLNTMQSRIAEKKKKEFKDHTYFDSKFRKNRGLDKFSLGKDVILKENNEYLGDEKGRKEDYNDLDRVLQKIEKELNIQREIEERNELERKMMEEMQIENERRENQRKIEEEEKNIQENQAKNPESNEEPLKVTGEKEIAEKNENNIISN